MYCPVKRRASNPFRSHKSATCLPLRGIHTLLLRHKIKKIHNITKIKLRRAGKWDKGAGLGRSGQVAVGVLLSVDSLQVFLLDQDVDAFLDDWDSGLES